jgi:hypothetical protein
MQMDWAAGTLKYNQAHYVPGTPLSVYDYQSATNTTIVPANGATASLYRYTPYITRPNTFCNLFSNTFGWATGIGSCNDPQISITDAVFTNSAAMNEAQIQAFLVAHGSYLANYTVPADYMMNVYRFYNTNGTHFYTASESEKNTIIAKWPNIYKLEGVAYQVNVTNAANNAPLYRFYNKQNGTHFYTASVSEKDTILSRWGYIYQLDGVAYNVSITGGTPVYRFYNTNGTHFYTISESEKNNVIARWPNVYRFEGVAFYVAQ